MATVTNAGVASGNDFESIISATVATRKQQLTKRVTIQKASLEIQQDGLNSLKSALDTFKTKCDSLVQGAGDAGSVLNTHKITTSQSDSYQAFSIKANDDCANTNFSVAVKQLSSSESISRKLKTDEGFTNSFSAGTLTFNLGDDENGNARTFDIDVSEGDSIEMIRRKINKNNQGVSCNIIQTSEGYSLSFSSDKTGKDSTSISITSTSTDSNGHDSLSLLAFNRDSNTEVDGDGNRVSSSGSSWSYKQGKDAIISIDGQEISAKTNEFNGQVSGVTITAQKVSETETINGEEGLKSYNVDITSDADAAKTKVQDFVNSYNSLMSTLSNLSKANTYTNGKCNYDGGDLAGDGSVKQIMSSLQNMVTRFQPTEEGITIFDCGIEFNKDGTLSLDSTKFNKAMEENFGAMTDLLTSTDGLAKQMSNYTKEFTQSSGILSKRLDNVKTEIASWTAKEERNTEILEKYEASLRQKYSRLDSLMAGYQTSMGYLSNVLAGLPSTSSSS